jgi:magnesium-transporting ATPase (P-type)
MELTQNYEALKRVTVIRDGKEVLMHPREVVVGDICVLDESATITGDGILLDGGRQGRGLMVDEAVLGRH